MARNDAAFNRLKKVTERLDPDKIVGRALTSVLAKQKERIFEKGLNSNGVKIGSYSIAYKEVRRDAGRETGFVNLQFTGQLDADYALKRLGGGRYALMVDSPLNADKIAGNEERYGNQIFHFTQAERKLLGKLIQDQANAAIRRTLK